MGATCIRMSFQGSLMVCTFHIFSRGVSGQPEDFETFRGITFPLICFSSVFLFFGVKVPNRSPIDPIALAFRFQLCTSKTQVLHAWIAGKMTAYFVLNKYQLWRAFCDDMRPPPAVIEVIIMVFMKGVEIFDL